MGEKDLMGILENFENAWDPDLQYESTPIKPTNNLGEPSLATKIFSETCCKDCSCKPSNPYNTEFQMDELDFNI
jgi:hypothetical protein